MAITVTDRGTAQTTVGGAITYSKASATFTASAGSVLVVAPFLYAHEGGNTVVFAMSDTIGDVGGGTWAQYAFSERTGTSVGNYNEAVGLWVRVVGGSPGSSKTVTATATIGGDNTSDDGWFGLHVWEISGVQTPNPVGRTASPTFLTSVTTFNTDFGATPVSTSVCFSTLLSGEPDPGGATVQPTGWTMSDDIHDAGFNAELSFAYKIGSVVQSPQWTGLRSAASDHIQGCSVEIYATPATVLDPNRQQPPGQLSPRGLLVPIGDPSVVAAASSSTNANAVTATATATALDTGKTVAASAGVAQATATANNATATSGTPAGSASANAVAYDTGKTVAASAAAATVTATANNAGKTVAISVSTATATATGNNASKTVAVNAGVAQATATVNSATVTSAAQQAFPTTVSANGRYIKDQFGNPWMMHGEAAWCLEVNPSLVQAQTYLADRASRGVNLVMVETFDHHVTLNTAPANYYNQSPFTGTAFQSTLNEAYWQNVDEIVNYAAAKGITVMLFVAYLGYNHGVGGWWSELAAASNAQVQTYGGYLGTRYKDKSNIIWAVGGDYTPTATEKDRYDHIMIGIQATGDTHLATGHNNAPADAAADYDAYSWFTLNAIYAYDPSVVATAATGYNRSTHRPTFDIENRYENYSAGAYTLAEIRRGQWQTVLVGGLGGHIVGNEDIWTFGFNTGYGGDYDWQSALSDVSITHSHQIKVLFDDLTSTKWIELAPDLTDTFLTSGESSGATQAAASFSTHIGLVYVATTGSITVDLTEISAHVNVLAKWFDPTNGAYTSVGTFATSAGHTFTHPGANAAGDNDWVLVITGTTDVSVSAGSASATATANNAGKTVAVNAGVAQATATANNASVQTGTFTTAQPSAATATATANDTGKTVSVNAGVAQAVAACPGPIAAIGATPGTAAVAATIANNIKASVAVGAIVAAVAAAANQPTSAGSGVIVQRYGPTVRSQRPRVFRTKRPGEP